MALHYSELNEERLHVDGERILKPPTLTPQELDDLVTFLESPSDVPRTPPAAVEIVCPPAN